MKRMRKLSMIASTVAIFAGLSGCNTVKDSNASDNIIYYSLGIDGDKEKIDENNIDIQEIIELSKKYINSATGSDYTKEYDGEEYTYYTNEMIEMYKEYGIIESTAEMIKENELKAEINNININSVEMYTVNKEEYGEAIVDFITIQEHATPEYLAEREIEIGVKYKRVATLIVVKEEGKWKVKDLLEITDREKVE